MAPHMLRPFGLTNGWRPKGHAADQHVANALIEQGTIQQRHAAPPSAFLPGFLVPGCPEKPDGLARRSGVPNSLGLRHACE